MKYNSFVCLIICFFSQFALAQVNLKGYYFCPVNPGKPNYLNGNMGELRPDHFHAGLDFRTNQDNSSPVYAAADGYISRIIISEYGYGNALIMKHPNGTTTLYAHLESFAPVIAEYVLKKQYEKQIFALEVLFDSTSFLTFKKGHVIALAGNTGSSGGPHLHFEIRDKDNYVLNPLQCNFSEFTDHISPAFTSIALRTFGISSRVNGQFGFFEFYPLKVSDKNYIIKSPILVEGQIGLEVAVFDMSEGSFGRNGVNCISVKLDGKPIYSHNLSRFLNDKTRHINLHIDYEQERTRNLRYQHCYLVNGNELDIYKTEVNKGRIQINDKLLHNVEVTIMDTYLNSSTLNFTIQNSETKFQNKILTNAGPIKPVLKYFLFDNIVQVKAKNAFTANASFYIKGIEKIIKADYSKQNENVYLWDLKLGQPDSVVIGKKRQLFYFNKMILPKSSEEVSSFNDSLRVVFAPASLFDTLYLELKRQKDTISVGRFTIPLKNEIEITFTPSQRINDKQRTSIYNLKWKKGLYRGGEWRGDKIVFTTREFGTFILKTDTTAPIAKFRSKPSPYAITCTILDDMSGIASYKATLDGEWLLMVYDPKNSKLTARPFEAKKILRGNFILQVTDKVGNVGILEKIL